LGIISKLLLYSKANEFNVESKTYYEHKLIKLKHKYESELRYAGNKFNVDLSSTNEANSLYLFFKHKVITSTIPVKEMLQHSDKMKIDKFLMSKKLEEDIENWEITRSKIEDVKEKQEIDLNAKRSKKRKVESNDVLIIDEDYEDLK